MTNIHLQLQVLYKWTASRCYVGKLRINCTVGSVWHTGSYVRLWIKQLSPHIVTQIQQRSEIHFLPCASEESHYHKLSWLFLSNRWWGLFASSHCLNWPSRHLWSISILQKINSKYCTIIMSIIPLADNTFQNDLVLKMLVSKPV